MPTSLLPVCGLSAWRSGKGSVLSSFLGLTGARILTQPHCSSLDIELALDLSPPITWHPVLKILCSKTEELILGWQTQNLGWVWGEYMHAFKTNQMPCSHQALDNCYWRLFPSWKCTSNDSSVADAGTAFPVGPGLCFQLGGHWLNPN